MNRFLILVFICFSIFCFQNVQSQNVESNINDKKNGLSLSYVGNTTLFGFNYDRFIINNKLNIEIGVVPFFNGIGGGIGVGGSYFMTNIEKQKFNFYLGLKSSYFSLANSRHNENYFNIYLPLGLYAHLNEKKKMFLNIDIGPSYFEKLYTSNSDFTLKGFPFEDFRLWGGLKFGFRF